MYQLLSRQIMARRIACPSHGRVLYSCMAANTNQAAFHSTKNDQNILKQRLSVDTIVYRPYHSTVSSCFPVRRRRRGSKRIIDEESVDGNSGDDTATDHQKSNALQHTPVRDIIIFRQAATDLFGKLERALTPMKVKNDPFIISRSHGDIGEIFKLDLGPKEGFYQIEISEEECVFEYSSPISGKILYCLSATTGEWVGVDDGNAFEGIFVRDLIRQCQGLPNL